MPFLIQSDKNPHRRDGAWLFHAPLKGGKGSRWGGKGVSFEGAEELETRTTGDIQDPFPHM